MFTENTVFILGAGASKPYGYPLGSELISEMIGCISKDVLYLPDVLPKISNQDHKHSGSFFISCTLPVKKASRIEKAGGRIQVIPDRVEFNFSNGTNVDLCRKKLTDIPELKEFRDVLNSHRPSSIDLFLNNNPRFSDVGKFMIAYTLLQYEDEAGVVSNTDEDGNKELDNWYSVLFDDILSRDVGKKISDNKLQIVTFNYDVSLEYYLFNRLKNTESIGGDEAESFMEQLSIHHVYGEISDNYQQYGIGNYVDLYNIIERKGDKLKEGVKRTVRFLRAKQLCDKIKLIDEERESEESLIKSKLDNADTIVIIGFGFDRTNLNRLGFTQSLSGNRKFLKGKTIKYLDFNGEMGGLSRQFEELGDEDRGDGILPPFIIKSTANKISSAYSKDFKLFLHDMRLISGMGGMPPRRGS